MQDSGRDIELRRLAAQGLAREAVIADTPLLEAVTQDDGVGTIARQLLATQACTIVRALRDSAAIPGAAGDQARELLEAIRTETTK